MSKKDFDDFTQRDTLSLFGDESRSNCTVAEAKAFEKDHRRSRRGRALWIGLPILLLLVAGLAAYIYIDHVNYLRAVEKERLEQENPTYQEFTVGYPDAKFVIDIEGTGGDSLPGVVAFVLDEILGTKPSEVCIHKTFSGEMSPKPLQFSMAINGKKEFQVMDDEEGVMVSLNVSNPLMKKELLLKVVNEEWNRCYPDAQYPLEVKIPVKPEPTAAEQRQMELEREKQERFSNIPIVTDPRKAAPVEE